MVFALIVRPGRSRQQLLGKIAKRTCLIFLIGYLLSWYPFAGTAFADTRIMAVLQRIALAYGFAGIVILYCPARALIAIGLLLLLGYWGILYYSGDPAAPYSLLGNGVRKVDLRLLGQRHMYREKGIAFDPEGLLSTLPAIVNVLAGYGAGKWIVRKGKTKRTVTGLGMAGVLLTGVGLLWNEVLPLNKKLWTSSYVCFTVGLDLIFLALLFGMIELLDWKRGTWFFSVFGRNPLIIYIFSNLIGVLLIIRVSRGQVLIDWVNAVFFQKIAPGPSGALLFSLCFTMICWSAGWVLDRKKIYIRL
jgi:predicted acyltransferase